MKKILFALLLGALLVLALVTVATADNGPHGGFTATTDACAGCHRVHSASYGSNALLITDPESLCLSCHNGAGAATNVEDGIYVAAGSPYPFLEGQNNFSLFGGGFVNALMATAWSGQATADPAFDAVSRPTTSHHNLGTSGTIWGSGANNTGYGGSLVLECTSCHDPHGTAGWTGNPGTKVASYRLLRWQPSGSDGFTPPTESVNWSGGAFPSNNAATNATTGWLVPDNFPGNGNEWYTLGTTNAFAVGDYNAGNANDAYNPTGHNYRPAAQATAFFCAQCHDRYFNNSRLRNNTDISYYCGKPSSSTSTLVVPIYDDADGVAPFIHPVDPVRCLYVASQGTTGWGWGDNGDSGDLTYMYRHTSGDLRASMDGTVSADTRTSVGRTCVACHVAHGTAAQMTALADGGSLAHGSVLLRMDNRSVCLRCHASTVNFVVGP